MSEDELKRIAETLEHNGLLLLVNGRALVAEVRRLRDLLMRRRSECYCDTADQIAARGGELECSLCRETAESVR